MHEIDIDAAQSLFQQLIERQSQADKLINVPLAYFLGELICNISQHSCSKYGYLYAQYVEKEGCIDICIADTGITIYGSYIKNKRYLDKIGDDEARAMFMANQGYSTKNLPNAENRGYGIRTTKKMLVNGLGGDFFMLSGGAFHRFNKDGARFVSLPADINWPGTIILMRVPVVAPQSFNYLNYVE